MIKLKNAFILTSAFDPIIKGEVYIKGNKIEAVCEKSQLPDKDFDEVIDCKNNLIMPSFCNCHSHTPMSLFRNIADDLSLETWLYDRIFPLENQLCDESIYWATMLSLAEFVKNGITCFFDMYFRGEETVFNCAKKANLAIAFTGGSNSYKTNVVNRERINFLKYNQIERQKYIIGLHAEYTCDEKLICDIADLSAEFSAPTCIHISETLKEVGDCSTKHNNLTPPQYLHKLGFFDNGGIVAHGVYLDKDDISLLKQSNVSVVSCPSANLKLASGIAPIYSILNNGLNICLGTDGVAGNNNANMFKEMYLLSTLQKQSIKDASVVSAENAIASATINGFKALKINSGEIKKGKFADLILIDLNKPNMQPLNDIKKSVVFSSNSDNVIMTISNGKIVYNNGEYFIGEKVEEIFKNCNKLIKKFKY